MSSSAPTKFPLRRPVVVDIGCNCRKSRLASLFSFTSRPKPKPTNLSTTTTASFSTWDPSFTTATTAPNSDSPSPPSPPPQPQPQPQRRLRRKKKSGRVVRESVAVVKETSEPYSEFKESMVQMIVEKEIYGWDDLNDLNDLLHQFLSLNSPRHHHLILRAFADLWSGVFSPPSPLAAGDHYAVPPPTYY